MSTWKLSRYSYYADVVTTPILAVASLAHALHTSGFTFALVAGFVLGAIIMSFIEYGVHRWVFHKTYRREHWQHHMRPAEYIGVPGTHTFAYFAVVFCATLALGTFGSGLFVGIVAAYLAYIISHDRYHHGHPETWTGYWARQWKRHAVHHEGKETNFGVSSPLWDHILGTYTS